MRQTSGKAGVKLSYYPKDEQETLYLYDPFDGHWIISSTYPPHIRQLLERAQIHRQTTDDDGRVIAVEGKVARNQIRLFKPILEPKETE